MVEEEYRSVLVKFYHMVNDPSSDSVISWGPNGNSFIIWNCNEFSRDFLSIILDSSIDKVCEGYGNSTFFTNILIRVYNFAKVYSDQQWEFSKEDFLRDKPELTLNKYTPKLDMYVAQVMKVWSMSTISFKCLTYLMVDDPSSDSIISWSSSGKSFIVWDLAEFSRVVLPRFCFHHNFSLFTWTLIRNGFRKVDAERWEFADEDFVRGKPEFLQNINNRPDSQVSRLGLKKRIMKKEKKMSKIAVEAIKDQMHGLQI